MKQDIRLRGFSARSSLAIACAWLDRQPVARRTEVVALAAEVASRVLAEPASSRAAWPDVDRAAMDGYAVRGADCDGASAYNPLMLVWLEPGVDQLSPGSVCPIATGWALPAGADAVLPFEAAQWSDGRWLEVVAPVAPGTGINPRGRKLRAGAGLLERGRKLRPQDLGCLWALGYESVSVLCRPQVHVVVLGVKSGSDALTPMLLALLARDGAVAKLVFVDGADELKLVEALISSQAGEAELVLLAGRSGTGPDDVAALALQTAGGALALHGLALRPGGSAGLGTLPGPHGEVPVVLLPGEPLACLVAYDMLAARLVRRLAGISLALPYPVATFKLERKIASAIGLVEIVLVRLADGRARPLSLEGGLAGSVRADGFVMVAEASEGHAAGASVQVHLY